MALSSDFTQQFADDFMTVDGLEVVHYQRYTETGVLVFDITIGTEDDLEEPAALRRASAEDVLIHERLIDASQITIWHTLTKIITRTGIEPRDGDVIIDNTLVRWVVGKIETQTFGVRYRFTCTRE